MATGKEIEHAAKAIFYCQFSIMHDHEELWNAKDCKRGLWRDCAKSALTAAEQVSTIKTDDLSGLVENIDARIQGKTECKISADEWLKISTALCAEQVRSGSREVVDAGGHTPPVVASSALENEACGTQHKNSND